MARQKKMVRKMARTTMTKKVKKARMNKVKIQAKRKK